MQAIKIKYSCESQEKQVIREYMRQYSSCLHYAYNRYTEGLKPIDIERQLKTLNNVPLMTAWLFKCCAYNIKNFKGKDKVIFGGKKNFIDRCKGKITKEEYKERRLSPIESNGEGNQHGNRCFQLTSDFKVIFKPVRTTHIELQLELSKHHKDILKKIYMLQDQNKPVMFQLGLEYVYIVIDETLIEKHNTEKIENRIFAIDLNPNYVGWSVVDWKSENEYDLIDKGVFSLKELNDKFFEYKGLPSSDKKKIKLTNKRTHEVYAVVRNLISKAIHYKCSIFSVEELNMNSKDHSKGKKYNRLVNNLWNRSKMVSNIHKWCNIYNIKFLEVKPNYSSFIGNIIFRNEECPDMVLASIEIGRRAYEFYHQYILKDKEEKHNIIIADSKMFAETIAKSLEEFGVDTQSSLDLKELYYELKKSKVKYRFPFTDKWKSFSAFSPPSKVVNITYVSNLCL